MGTTRRSALIFTGGTRDDADAPALPAADLVIAADSGIIFAADAGWAVDIVVGDLDSAPPDAVTRAEAGGARIERHPAAKDHTDLELALMTARTEGITDVTVAGGVGGRLDHLLANILLLGSPEWAGMSVDALIGGARVSVVGAERPGSIAGDEGGLVSLLAVGGPAEDVRTEGLLYPLHDETLHPGSTRGVSNVLTGARATVAVGAGTVLVVQP
ncbi:MAG TPA: thiamine diphosphokinase [Acidimicrobiales bacterium]|nr:thiamine diphosphokinase [Acidimicrobiales bacterium]